MVRFAWDLIVIRRETPRRKLLGKLSRRLLSLFLVGFNTVVPISIQGVRDTNLDIRMFRFQHPKDSRYSNAFLSKSEKKHRTVVKVVNKILDFILLNRKWQSLFLSAQQLIKLIADGVIENP